MYKLQVLICFLIVTCTYLDGKTPCKSQISDWSEWTNCTCSDGGCYQYSYRQRRDCHGDGQERGLEPGFHTDWWPMECKISQLNVSSEDEIATDPTRTLARTETQNVTAITDDAEKGERKRQMRTDGNTADINAFGWVVSAGIAMLAGVINSMLLVIFIRRLKSYLYAGQKWDKLKVPFKNAADDTGSYYIIVEGRKNHSQTYSKEMEK